MRRTTLGALLTILTLVSACTGAGVSPASPSPPSSPSAATASEPSPSAAAETIDVRLTDALRIEPTEMIVKAGQQVRFVVTNTGTTDHEFYLGDAAAQEEHAKEMASMGGMMHDEPQGISLKPGETKELSYTFPTAGPFLAGCHVDAHYASGMKASITVTG